MKKFFSLLLSAALLATTACSDDNDNGTPASGLPAGYTYADDNTAISGGNVTGDMLFFGTSTVKTTASGAIFTDEKALFELVNDGEGKVRILMHETRFAPTMPALEMEVPGISYVGTEKTISIRATSVIPEIKGTPYERYTITRLTGNTENTTFKVAFTCAGAFEVTYDGRLIVKN